MNIWRHTRGREGLYRPAGRMPDCERCPVRDHSMCAGLNAAERKWLAEKTDQLEAPSGQVLYYEGDAARHFLTIRSGVVRLVRAFPDGRRSIVGFLHEGDYLGGGFGRKFYDATAEAVTPLDYCRIAVPDLEALSRDFPGLCHQLAGMAERRLHAAGEHIVLLSRKTALEKVAAFLLASAEWTGNPDRFDLPMARSDIADYLGLTIETVSRTMTRLIENQVIALPTPQQVRVLDKAELCALARPEGSGVDLQD